MNMPHIKFDWTFNIGHVISVGVFVLAGVGAWYDVKADVKVISTRQVQVEQMLVQQKHTDELQDTKTEQQRIALTAELKDALKDTKNDIKQDIRDLRNDAFRKK